jgi:Domain of unknown function (DUF4864)
MQVKHSIGLALLLLVPALPAWAQKPTPAPKEASEPVMKQLEAFRRGDFDTAYTFASSEIKEQFDRPTFEHMVKNGYPEIARSTSATVAGSTLAPNGNAYLSIKIRGANGNSIEALYELILENGQWKINGVSAKPDRGLVLKTSPSGETKPPLLSGESAGSRSPLPSGERVG